VVPPFTEIGAANVTESIALETLIVVVGVERGRSGLTDRDALVARGAVHVDQIDRAGSVAHAIRVIGAGPRHLDVATGDLDRHRVPRREVDDQRRASVGERARRGGRRRGREPEHD
jgi:hypothetical protein